MVDDPARPGPREDVTQDEPSEAERLVNELEQNIIALSNIPTQDLPARIRPRLAKLRNALTRVGKTSNSGRNIVEDIINRGRRDRSDA